MKKPRLVKSNGYWLCIVSSDNGESGMVTKDESMGVAYDMMRLRLWLEYKIKIPARNLQPHEPGYGIQQLY
jgi:hypothetical protein